jgi:uroporphyrinogen decarboxylase
MAEGWDARETFLHGQHRDTLWEKAYMLVGMENLMCYFHTEKAAVRELLHRIMDFQLGMTEHYLAVGVEMVGLGDDLGTQQGPLLPPEIVEEFFVPEYRRLFSLYRSRQVIIGFHSCGNIMRFLDMFMDLGVNVLNPVQASANDLDELRRRTQGRMALAGGVNSDVVYDGPPARIRELVARRLWQLGRDGGYFCQQDQGLPFPEEHLVALRSAVEEFGRYPLRRMDRTSAGEDAPAEGGRAPASLPGADPD